MSANLTPQFHKAKEEYHRSSTNEEKLVALEEMLRTIPKHKGTDKMQANIKTQLSKVKSEAKKQSNKSKQKPFWIIERQGAARIVLVGPPNTGKSQFLLSISNAATKVAPYPYTTQKPIPGMAVHKNIQLQIIDLPPFTTNSPSWIMEIIRTSDLVLIFLDTSSDSILSQLETLSEALISNNLKLLSPLVINDYEEESDFIEDADLFADPNSRKAIIIANKCDKQSFSELFDIFLEFLEMLEIDLPIHNISAKENLYIDSLFDNILDYLEIISAYTKAPGEEPNYNEPVALRKGATLTDLAMIIHKDFANKLKFARVWGPSTFDGQKVSKDYVICNQDVVEFNI